MIGAFANAEQRYRGLLVCHHEDRSSFADIDSVAIPTERIAVVLRKSLKRIKATKRHPAERVHAANHCGIAQTRVDKALRRGENFRARGTRRRDCVCRTLKLEIVGDKGREIADL